MAKLLELNYLSDIASFVDGEIDSKLWLNYSLLGGDFGAICLLYYYSEVNHSYLGVADDYLDKMLKGIPKMPVIYTYCNGLAGLGLGLQLLEEDGFLSGVSSSLMEYDEYLCSILPKILNLKSLDFLHGIIGVGLYFLSRNKYNPLVSKMCINQIIGFLYSSLSRKGNQIYWELMEDEFYKRFNISLSHGSSSILIFLSRVYRMDLDIENKELVRDLINGIVNHTVMQKLNPEKFGSFFPSFPAESKLQKMKSRLAWCYGDLGIAVSLLEAAEATGNSNLNDFGMEILEYAATNRRNVESNSIHDAGICHGAIGVSQIFKRQYNKTQMPIFKEASLYWKNIALSFSQEEQGRHIFKSYNNQTKSWENSISILEGNAGVGLSLLNADSFLDKILLLS